MLSNVDQREFCKCSVRLFKSAGPSGGPIGVDKSGVFFLKSCGACYCMNNTKASWCTYIMAKMKCICNEVVIFKD